MIRVNGKKNTLPVSFTGNFNYYTLLHTDIVSINHLHYSERKKRSSYAAV